MMQELIDLYRGNRTNDNAIKLRDYHREQPMETSMFMGRDAALIIVAIVHANRVDPPNKDE